MKKQLLFIAITFFSVASILAQGDITLVDLSTTPVSCGGESDGTITIEVDGGDGQLYFSLYLGAPLEGSGWTDSRTFTFQAGTGYAKSTDYAILVSDNNPGTVNLFIQSVEIGGPDPISIDDVFINGLSCAGEDDGRIIVTAYGEQGVFDYQLNGPGGLQTNTSGTFPDLAPGTYTVDVTDGTGTCSSSDSRNNLEVTSPPILEAFLDNVTDVDCYGGFTGVIEISVTGGTPFASGDLYAFSWTGPNGFTSVQQNLSGLEAGTYEVTVTDANGCTDVIANIQVNQNSEIEAIFNATQIDCNGAGNGAINANVFGGTPPYDFVWTSPTDPGFNETTKDLSGLEAGEYTLTVTDALNCVMPFPAQSITEPAPLTASFSSTNVTCNGDDDGIITVTPGGGVPPYTYSWTASNGYKNNTDKDLSGLAPGLYTLELGDANGCSELFSDIIEITEPLPLSVTPTTTDVTCYGNNDGTISLALSGGTPGYSVNWTGPGGYSGSGQSISNLGPGTYNATITDGNGCLYSYPVTITEPPAIEANILDQGNALCNGGNEGYIEISVIGGSGTYSTIEWKNSGGTVVATGTNPTGLSAGNYTLEITDDSDCSIDYPDYVTITEPDELETTTSTTDVECNGESTGVITASTVGGTSPFEYSLNGSPFTTNNEFPGLPKGTYILDTRDANGCTDQDIVGIEEPDRLQFVNYGVFGEIECYGDATGIIRISSVKGGVPPYEYSIDNGATYQSENEFPGLPAGVYPLKFRDSQGCEWPPASNPVTLTIDQPNELVIANYNQNDITTCYEDETGEITIIGGGGTGDLLYSLDDGTPIPLIGQFNNVPGGLHDLRITDENGCPKDTTVEILRPAELVFDQVNVTDVTGCSGDNTGAVEIVPAGGTPPYSYSSDGINFQPGSTFSGLTAGSYTFYLRDANLCEKETGVDVSEPEPLSITDEFATPASCNGGSDGAVEITVTGGTAPYTYTLDPALPSIQDEGEFSGLPMGDYTISVTDSETCGPITSGILTVSEPEPLVLDSVRTQYISCNNANDASINIYVSGGTEPYEYSVNNGTDYFGFSEFTGLSGGIYQVRIRDANGCPLDAGSIEFTNPAAINLTATPTDVGPCGGLSNGEISVTATGGWESFTYSLNGTDYQSTGDFTGLAAGEYTVFVLDTGNCTATTGVTIDEPEPVTATVTKTDYVANILGTINITGASGGTAPYSYSINGDDGPFTTNTIYTDLTAGNYEVVVRGAGGCEFREPVIIYDIIPLNMLVNTNDVTCNGLDDGTIELVPEDAEGLVLFSIDSGASFTNVGLFEDLPGDSTYSLFAFDEGGKQFWGQATIDEPTALQVFKSISPAECNSFSETGGIDLTTAGGTGEHSFAWSDGSTDEDLTNVVAGAYSVTVTDEAGCMVIDDIFIPSLIIVNADAGTDTTVCAGATIELDAKMATTMSWSPSTYLSDTMIANPVVSEIADSIMYTYTVTETTSPYGCSDTDTIYINVLPSSGIEITPDTVVFAGQPVQLGVLEGEFESFTWAPSQGLDADDIANPTAIIDNSTIYILVAENAFGCEESDSVFIEVIEDLTVYNVFSPNGDDVNEYFEIDNGDSFPDILVEVYNRWGTKVFSSIGYSDDKRWDGTVKGKDAPLGTYYYVIIPYSGATPITGNVTIIR